jgi:hypothetical protein
VCFDLAPGAPHLTTHEPPAYAVVLIGETDVVVHTHDYLDDSPRFPFSKPDLDDRAYMLGPVPALGRPAK